MSLIAEALKAQGEIIAGRQIPRLRYVGSNSTTGPVIEARYVVNRLKNHLKAWDKNHDNAQSMGHMLRKQMEKGLPY